MIEKKFIQDIVKGFQIEEFISDNLSNVGFSKVDIHKTPLGEKIIIHASRPGLVVGRKGENIQNLTKILKNRFKFDKPQIEIVEVEKQMLDANIVGEKIASSLERFGSSRFKGIAHKTISEVMDSGAQGIEVTISGKIPSTRAKTWRFNQGYIKKSGDIAVSGLNKAFVQARLKTGVVGIQVRIMPPELKFPDLITEITEDMQKEAENKEKKEAKPQKSRKKQSKNQSKSGSKQKDIKSKSKKSGSKKSDAKSEKLKSTEEKSKSSEDKIKSESSLNKDSITKKDEKSEDSKSKDTKSKSSDDKEEKVNKE